MTATRMDYWRVSCDFPECVAVINVASMPGTLAETMDSHKWRVSREGRVSDEDAALYVHLTYCPDHKDAVR